MTGHLTIASDTVAWLLPQDRQNLLNNRCNLQLCAFIQRRQKTTMYMQLCL